jgi:hypothetical protein
VLEQQLPRRVGLSGRLRTISTVPACASSARRRCDTADWVMLRRCAARSKPPFDDGGQAFQGMGSKVFMGGAWGLRAGCISNTDETANV